MIDTDATQSIIDELGTGTFSPRALELTSKEGEQLAIPSDGWAQMLVYRKDLFDAAGLEAPTSFDTIREAAKTLDSPDVAGFVGATVPNDAFTQQTFEHLALGNDCQMVTTSGEIEIDSAGCVESFEFYNDLLTNYSVQGAQDVDTTRATYFAGGAAMTIWSSFLLDEMAGLRADAMPNCPECAADPAYLAKNSGIVTAIEGPSGSGGAPYGEVVSWVVTAGTQSDPASKFVTYMMEEGYSDWLGFAPEGKIPVRQGTSEEPTKFLDEWKTLPVGVDTKAPLADFYSSDVLETLQLSPDTFKRWGITQGQGALIGASLGELPVPQAINAMVSGEANAKAAARQAADDLTAIMESLQ
jgi:multiple sugar transport system substrate-binding protein